MCWKKILEKFKSKEKPTPKPTPNVKITQKGIVCTACDRDVGQIKHRINPMWVRYAITQADSFEACSAQIREFKRQGLCVLASFQDKYHPFDTIELAEPYMRAFRNQITYACWNEPNSDISPANEDWNNYLEPKYYVGMLGLFYDKAKITDNNIVVSMAGLNGLCTSNSKNREMDATKYLKECLKLGLSLYTNWWMFHMYDTVDSRFHNIRNTMLNYSNAKPLVIGEFGTHKENKISNYDYMMKEFGKNGVDVAFVYGWEGGDAWSIRSRPEFAEHIKNYA